MTEAKTYYKNFLTLLSGNTLSQFIPFIIAPILSRLFLPEEFAVFANFLAIATLFGIVSAGRLELAIPIPKSEQQAKKILHTAIIFTAIVTLLSLATVFFRTQIGIFYESETLSAYLFLIPLSVFSIGTLSILSYWTLRQGNYRKLSTSKVIQAFANNGLAACFGFYGWGTSGLIAGWIIGQFISIAILYYRSTIKPDRSEISSTSVKEIWNEYKDFPLINSLHAFTDIFATQVVLFWLIAIHFGLLELGLFTMMSKYVRAPIGLITNSVSQLFYKEASQGISDNRGLRPLFFRTLKTSVFFAIPFLIVLLFFAPWLFKVYLGSNWETAGVYAQYFCPTFLMLFITSPISGIPLLFNKQKEAFMFAVLNYGVSLLVLYLSISNNWESTDSLLLFSGTNALLNVGLLFWYYKLIQSPINKEELNVNSNL